MKQTIRFVVAVVLLAVMAAGVLVGFVVTALHWFAQIAGAE